MLKSIEEGNLLQKNIVKRDEKLEQIQAQLWLQLVGG